MDPEPTPDAEDRLAARAEELDAAIAAGTVPPAIEWDTTSPPEELAMLRAAQESLLRLERLWPRGGSRPEPTSGTATEPVPGAECLAPAQFGRFRIVRELGRGGFGVVFLATDSVLNRPVALKLPRAEWLLSAGARARFAREALAVAGLDHPNIAPLYEAGEVHGVCYMASAYCDGPDLAGWLRTRGGPIDPHTAARIVAELADAIQHAHDRGVLHRDLKPSNILLQRRSAEAGAARPTADDGATEFRPRIVDFGLARLMDRPAGEVTASFAAVGSAPYTAPEQAEGNKVGPAADIYGLGAILYAMLCERPPHRGRSDLDTLRRVVADEIVPPRRLRPDLPRDLEAICLKCLERDPARRFSSAGALAEDLRRFLAGQPTQVRPPGRWELARRGVRRHRIALTALVIFTTATIAILEGRARYEARIRQTRAAVTLRSEEARLGNEAARHAGYVADLRLARSLIEGHHARRAIGLLDRHRPGPGESDLRGFAWHYLLGRCDTSRRTLRGFSGPVYHAEFSPRGDLLAAAGKDGFVRIWKTISWELLHAFRADEKEANAATFSPDGVLLATVGDEGTLKLWEVATERQRFERPAHDGDAVVARFTPDGKRIITGGRNDGILKLWDVERGVEIKSVRAHAGAFECAAVSRDGRYVATSGAAEVKLWDVSTLSALASPPYWTGHAPQGVDFSHDGMMLVLASSGVQLLDVPSLHIRRELLDHVGGVFAVAFGRDDRTSFSAGGDAMIRCWDMVTGALRWARHGHTGKVWCLAVSPDGRTVASTSDDGTVKIWDAEPPREHDTITIEGPLAALRFSRDGMLIAALDQAGRYSIRESGTGRLVRARLLDSSAPSPPPRRPICAAIAEDLRTILVADADGVVTVWDAEHGRFLPTLGDRHNLVLLTIAPDSTNGYLVRSGGQAEFWDLRHARLLKTLEGRFGGAIALPDGPRWLIDDVERGRPVIWEPTRDRVMIPRTPIRFIPKCWGLSLDGRRLAFHCLYDGPDERVRLIDTDRLVELPSPIVSPVGVSSVAFDPTGRILAGGCADHRVRLWDIAGGDELLTLEGHSGAVSRVHFFPDGGTLATVAGRPDGTAEIFLWRAARE